MKSWEAEVRIISSSAVAVQSSLLTLTESFHSNVQRNGEELAEQVIRPLVDLIATRCRSSTQALTDCLEDLVSMSNAMAPMIEMDPDHAAGMLMSLFDVLLKQMAMYYKDSSAAFEAAVQLMRRAKGEVSHPGLSSTATPATNTPQGTHSAENSFPTAAAVAAEDAGVLDAAADVALKKKKKKQSMRSSAVGGDDDDDADTATSMSAGPRKRKKKKKLMESDGDDRVRLQGQRSASIAPLHHPEALDLRQGDTPAPAATRAVEDFDGVARQGSSVTAAVATDKKRRPAAERELPDAASGPPVAVAVAPGKAAGPPPPRSTVAPTVGSLKEPEYLHVTSTIEDALGRVYLSSRPEAFSPTEALLRHHPRAEFYIRLEQPGRLSLLAAKAYAAVEEGVQADFMCDILEVDSVEIQPFSTTDGEIELPANLDDLSTLPVCGWRLGTSEDSAKRLFTSYVLYEKGPHYAPFIAIHDCFQDKSKSDEVLHVISLVDGASQFAKVAAYELPSYSASSAHLSGRPRAAHDSHADTIRNMTKSLLDECGFHEVPEGEVRDAVRRATAAPPSPLSTSQPLRRDEAAVFQPPVELARIESQAQPGGTTFAGVARGAVGVATGLVMAPVNATIAVSNAVMDISGMGDAIKNSTESLFRKGFPQLQDEPITETFNCALAGRDTIMRQGVLFVTPHWLCFAGTVLNANFAVEFEEIRAIERTRSMRVLGNAIEITTHLNDTYFLTSFLQRDRAYNALMRYWISSSKR